MFQKLEAVEKRYNNAVSLEYNAFEREIREKELVAENERLRRQIDFIKRGLAEIDRFLSKYNEYGFVKVIRKAVNNIINIIELKAVEVIEK